MEKKKVSYSIFFLKTLHTNLKWKTRTCFKCKNIVGAVCIKLGRFWSMHLWDFQEARKKKVSDLLPVTNAKPFICCTYDTIRMQKKETKKKNNAKKAKQTVLSLLKARALDWDFSSIRPWKGVLYFLCLFSRKK